MPHKYYQILSSSDRWQVGIIPHAYSDQLEVTALSLVMRRILRFRLNIHKIVLSLFHHTHQGWWKERFAAPQHGRTGIKPTFQDVLVLKRIQWLQPDKSLAQQVQQMEESSAVLYEATKHRENELFPWVQKKIKIMCNIRSTSLL